MGLVPDEGPVQKLAAASSGSRGALLRPRPPQNRACHSSRHTAQASPVGVAGCSAGLLRCRAVSARQQEACIRHGAASRVPGCWPGALGARSMDRWVTSSHQLCHSSGESGRWPGVKSRSPHSGQQPRCLASRLRVSMSSGVPACPGGTASSSARAGSSGDALPLTSTWRRSPSRSACPGSRRCRGRRIPTVLPELVELAEVPGGDPACRLVRVRAPCPLPGEFPQVVAQGGEHLVDTMLRWQPPSPG